MPQSSHRQYGLGRGPCERLGLARCIAPSKHAVVRVSEALYASLREQRAQIGVTVLCPGLVNTRIYESERNRPRRSRPAGGATAEIPELEAIASDLYAHGLSPEAVAEQVFDAVREQRFYQITTPNYDDAIRDARRSDPGPQQSRIPKSARSFHARSSPNAAARGGD